MKRCNNNTVSAREIIEVRELAQHLLQAVHGIQFVMTPEEQEGLYSLIRNLEFETWHKESSNHGWWNSDVQSQKLKDLIDQIKESPNESA